jgi:acetolactate synthase-1/2/3 large subunit
MARSGGRILVDNLISQGVTSVSCVPGESYLPVLDALGESADSISLFVCRHEAAAGNMAEAYGKLTSRAGVVAVTRGPGAMHAAIAVHTAQQDATPIILLVGQVSSADRGRGGFQEIDCGKVFGSIAKWVVSLDTIDRIPETIARAVRIAESGRPGPVVVEMPENVLSELSDVDDVQPVAPLRAAPTPAGLADLKRVLSAAERPLVLVGRGPWSQLASDRLEQFVSRNDLPVLAAFRCQDRIDNTANFYVGHLGLAADAALIARVEAADVIIAIGGHLGDAETKGYEILGPNPDRTVVHVSNDPIDLDRYVRADIAIQSDALALLDALADFEILNPQWAQWRAECRAEEEIRSMLPEDPDDVLAQIVGWLRESTAPETIVANGAGNYAAWVHQFFHYRRFGSQLAPASGAMGYGLPAGLAAKVLHPERTVVVFAGDGCFMMASPELATAKAYGLNVIVVVVNNEMFGTIRLHQERRYPNRVSGTDLVNPSFSAYAQAFGLPGTTVRTLEDFTVAFNAAESSGKPSLIEVLTDPDRALPRCRLSTVTGAGTG